MKIILLNIKTLLWLICLVIGISLLIHCDEQIPEGPELVQVIEANLTTDRQEYPQPSNYSNRYRTGHIPNFSTITDSRVRFQVKVTNTFDETVEGIEWTEISVKIWSAQLTNLTKTMTFTERKEDTEWLILHPGETHHIFTLDSLVWDQADDSCHCIHETDTFVPFSVRLDSVFNKHMWRVSNIFVIRLILRQPIALWRLILRLKSKHRHRQKYLKIMMQCNPMRIASK